MNRAEVMIELLRIAATCVSPTVNDRAEEVAQMAKQWYKECTDDTLLMNSDNSVEDKPRKRMGRPPKTVTVIE